MLIRIFLMINEAFRNINKNVSIEIGVFDINDIRSGDIDTHRNTFSFENV
jgi:hypothetical protein